jgi:long-chain fatty acid transport protein
MSKQTRRFKRQTLLCLLCGGATLLGGNAMAVNGAQLGGYGIQNAMMGGASIALPLDAVAAANNPAGMAYIPTSFTTNIQLFQGESSSNYVLPGNHLTNSTTSVVPEAGVNWVVNPQITVGLTLAGSGVGADYKQPVLPVPGAINAKSNLTNLEIIPSASWKINPDFALGVGLNLVNQSFDAEGVIVPTPVGPQALPNHGTQSATGVGLRMGALWKATSEFSVGFNYKSRTDMGTLSGYDKDLLAYSSGKLDIPEQYGVGVAWKPVPEITIAADWLQIRWSGIKAMQDPNGFSWQDQPVMRAGVAWDVNPSWTLRAGYSQNQNQIQSSTTAQNLLAPSINASAYSAGASFKLDSKSTISAGIELNPDTTLNGTGPSAGTSISSKITIIMLGYSHAF